MASVIAAIVLFFLLAPQVLATQVSYQRLPREDVHVKRPTQARESIAGLVASDIQRLIACESQGRNVAIVDSNGKMSYGILQFQQSTWDEFSAESGIKGSPMVPSDAIRMATWALEHGYIHRWSCARILGLTA